MSTPLFWVSLLVGQPLAGTASEAPQRTRTIGVFDLKVTGIDRELQSTGIDALAAAIDGVKGLKAVSRNDLEAMLSAEVIKDQLGCDDVTCLAEIGAAAGVSLIVSGSVSLVEGSLLVNLQLTNTEYASVENRVTLRWEGSHDRLADVLSVAAETLVIKSSDREPGTLRLTGVPDGAGVLINGEARGVGAADYDGLSVGVHALRIEAEGFIPHQEPFLVRTGTTTELDIHLAEEPPFYTRWWFWTGAGVLVVGAGAATAGILLSKSSEPSPSGIEFTTTRPIN